MLCAYSISNNIVSSCRIDKNTTITIHFLNLIIFRNAVLLIKCTRKKTYYTFYLIYIICVSKGNQLIKATWHNESKDETLWRLEHYIWFQGFNYKNAVLLIKRTRKKYNLLHTLFNLCFMCVLRKPATWHNESGEKRVWNNDNYIWFQGWRATGMLDDRHVLYSYQHLHHVDKQWLINI